MDWEGGTHASTFGGNPVSCAAALAVIDVIKSEKLLDNATQQGAHVMKRMKEVMEDSEIIGDVRGKGLMIGVEIVENKKGKKPASDKANEIMMRSWKRGVAIITCGKSTLRIVPPLVITRDLVDSALDIITSTIKEVEKEK
jgi:4-aminobutyrate aminotransferase